MIDPEKLIIEEHRIATEDPAITLYLRNKRPVGMKKFTSPRTVLFVHGATYPSSTTFDFALVGWSWMDFIATHGYDVWALDLRGYGQSTRPRQMEEAPKANGPIVHTDDAVADLARAVAFIKSHRQLKSLALLGYSWGTIITAAYTADNPDDVERLALYATTLTKQDQSGSLIGITPPEAAYRLVDGASARARWMHGRTESEAADLVTESWIERWISATMATDPQAEEHDPPMFRAPTGVVVDACKYWLAGNPYYDASEITCPTLIIVGEWDVETPPEQGLDLYGKLCNVTDKRFVLLGRATHSALLERRRLQLFREVQNFLREDF
jgi:pimeloyl-ACP methyl ester carboxylesterase